MSAQDHSARARHNGSVPRIEAATVAEHHVLRRTAIIDAAAGLLGGEGPTAVTPAAVASSAGLARSSVYQYFASTGALLAVAVEELFARSTTAVSAAVAQAATPAEQIEAFVDAALDAALAGHLPASHYSGPELPEQCRARVTELHVELVRPLVEALRAAGTRDAVGVAGLVMGVMVAAAGQVRRGESAARVRTRVRAFVAGALA